MYGKDTVGPWPIIDIGDTHPVRQDTVASTVPDDPLNILLDTQNLGGNTSAYICNTYMPSTPFGATGGNLISFGVLLTALENITSYDEGQSIMIDLSMSATHNQQEYSNIGPFMFPWIGYIDASQTPVDGWNATHNRITHWHMIPFEASREHLSLTTHILLRDILSGNLLNNRKIACGFSLRAPTGDTIGAVMYMISAEYSIQPHRIYKGY